MKHNRTVDRAVGMLDILSRYPCGLSLNEIVELMNIPKSSCFDILHTLVNTNMAESVGRDGKFYRIGDRTFNLSNQYIENKKLLEIAKNRIEIIGNKYSKTVIIAKNNDENAVLVYKYQPKLSNIGSNCAVGTIIEYHNTVIGKCMLAFRSDCFDLINEYEKNNIIDNKTIFIEDIRKIRQEKYAYGSDLSHELYYSAVPIFDNRGVIISSLCIVGTTEDTSLSTQETIELRQIASEISLEIGYTGEF